MGTGPLMMWSRPVGGGNGADSLLGKIMSPSGAVRITQMSDFLKVFAGWRRFAPAPGGQ